jgi:hypothetical protein
MKKGVKGVSLCDRTYTITPSQHTIARSRGQMDKPYCFRLWLVQEIALAARMLVSLTTATYTLETLD